MRWYCPHLIGGAYTPEELDFDESKIETKGTLIITPPVTAQTPTAKATTTEQAETKPAPATEKPAKPKKPPEKEKELEPAAAKVAEPEVLPADRSKWVQKKLAEIFTQKESAKEFVDMLKEKLEIVDKKLLEIDQPTWDKFMAEIDKEIKARQAK